jgi:Resolvase, N terminal domain
MCIPSIGSTVVDVYRWGSHFTECAVNVFERSFELGSRCISKFECNRVHMAKLSQFLNASFTKLVGETSDNSGGQALVSMLGAVAEFERSMIRERQREGIALAREPLLKSLIHSLLE